MTDGQKYFIVNFIVVLAVIIIGLYVITTAEINSTNNLIANSTIENITVVDVLYEWSESCGTFTLGCGSHNYLTIVRNEDNGQLDTYVFTEGWEVSRIGTFRVTNQTSGRYYVLRPENEYPLVWSIVT